MSGAQAKGWLAGSNPAQRLGAKAGHTLAREPATVWAQHEKSLQQALPLNSRLGAANAAPLPTCSTSQTRR